MDKKKKTIIGVIVGIIVLLLIILLLKGCQTKEYKITFDTNGGNKTSALKVEKNNKIKKPENPEKEGYEFLGWYYNDELFDFNTKINKNIKLEARWKKITKEIESISLDKKVLNVYVGDLLSLKVAIAPSDAKKQDLVWISSDTSIVTVDENGNIKALKEGKVTITVTTKDGKQKAKCNVNVTTKKSAKKSVTSTKKTTTKSVTTKPTTTKKPQTQSEYIMTKFNVITDLEGKTDYTSVLKKALGFEEKDSYKDGKLTNEDGKLSGLLLKNDKITLNEEDKQKYNNPLYFFAYILEIENASDKTTIELNGMNGKGQILWEDFDVKEKGKTPGVVVLVPVDPYKLEKNPKIEITVDTDGKKEEYMPVKKELDLTGLKLQKITTAKISVEKSDVAETDKTILNKWGYQFPNDIKLSSDNKKHTNGDLKYDQSTNKLSGTIKEQKLTGGFGKEELDSYFFTYTIKPNKVTDNIKVTIEDANGLTTYTKENFANDTLTILHHIALDKKDGNDKTIKIIVDADGNDINYTASEEYVIDYSDVDFVDLHTVTITDNEGNVKETHDIYDGEKFAKPSNPEVPKHEVHEKQYNTFDHWNVKVSDEQGEDKEYQFTEEVTEDITLYPIWEIDVEQYISDVIKHVNEKENVRDIFKIEEEKYELKLEILNKAQKIDEITNTDISLAIAHALASNEIDSVILKLGTNEKELKSETLTETLIKDFFKEVLDNEEGKTLHDLCQKINSKENSGLTVTIVPKKNVAVLSDKQQRITYHITFDEEVRVSFKAWPLENPSDIIIESASELPTPVISDEEKDYREFDGWYKADGTKVESLSDIKEDMTLTAHYKLNVDKFISDVIKDLDSSDTTHSKDFSSKFDLKQNEKNKNQIEIYLKSANLPLNELAETSIPGTIAYVLEKGEIKDISLGFEGENKKFSNETKEEVIALAKELFNEKLDGKENKVTLDQLEYSGKSFDIMIGDVNDTVKLVDSEGKAVANKTYTFKFNSDFVVVDQNNDLGAKKISDALKKGYDKIYVASDVTENDVITISKNVTIEPIETNVTKKTITVVGKDTVIDVQNGNVTIKSLKLTGGKKSELKIEKDAIVTVDSIDVSGEIEVPKGSLETNTDEMHANILVEGKLTVNGTITNDNESYQKPTMALVRTWAHPGIVSGEEQEKEKNENIHPDASITVTGMTKNTRYSIIKKEVQKGIDSTVETYYGDFYYIKPNNSYIYYLAIMDNQQPSSSPYDKIKIYYYDEPIMVSELGYESKKAPVSGDLVFEKLVLQKNEKIEVKDNSKPNELGLDPHTTNIVYARYVKKPASALTIVKTEGLTNKNNSLSGILTTQDKSGKYNIPVTISSNKFEEGVSTVNVINPNGEVKNYTYTLGNTKEASLKTMKINLEAIKESKISGVNGKVYTIKVDVDGAGNNYEEETYIVDYNNVNTLEEVINKAAENTHKVNSFTVKKNNKINGYKESFTYKFNREEGLTHYLSDDKKVEEYTFSLKYVGKKDSKASVVVEKETNHEEEKVYLNDWVYVHPVQVGTAIHEVSMLTDVMKDTKTTINAIDIVELIDAKQHTYKVTLNRDKYNDWVKKNYLSNSNYTFKDLAKDEKVILEVKLSDDEQYIKSLKTFESSSINTFNVTFEGLNATYIDEPIKFLAKDGKTLTNEDIIDFYNKGVKWWEEHTGATVYSK